jgi:hypothetical protein
LAYRSIELVQGIYAYINHRISKADVSVIKVAVADKVAGGKPRKPRVEHFYQSQCEDRFAETLALALEEEAAKPAEERLSKMQLKNEVVEDVLAREDPEFIADLLEERDKVHEAAIEAHRASVQALHATEPSAVQLQE